MNKLPVDTTSLAPYVTNGANLCLIVTKRVQSTTQKTPQLYNKYFCAGDVSKLQAYETWSSSKIFAMANAAGIYSNQLQAAVTDNVQTTYRLLLTTLRPSTRQ